MAIQAIGQKYLGFFFFLGQSAYNPYYNPTKSSANNNKLKRRFLHFSQFVPSTVSIVLLSTTCPFYWKEFVNRKFSFKYCVQSISTLSKMITCIMVFTCSPYFKNDLNILWLKFQQLEHYANQRLKITWSFERCIKSYQHKVFWMIFFLISRIVLKFAFFEVSTTISFILVTASVIAQLHVLFYIDCFVFMLGTVNKQLINSHANYLRDVFLVDGKIVITNIGFYKCLHYKFWQIANAINSSFGWVLLSILIQTMITLLSALYWIVVDFYDDDFTNNFEVISMNNNKIH